MVVHYLTVNICTPQNCVKHLGAFIFHLWAQAPSSGMIWWSMASHWGCELGGLVGSLLVITVIINICAIICWVCHIITAFTCLDHLSAVSRSLRALFATSWFNSCSNTTAEESADRASHIFDQTCIVWPRMTSEQHTGIKEGSQIWTSASCVNLHMANQAELKEYGNNWGASYHHIASAWRVQSSLPLAGVLFPVVLVPSDFLVTKTY